MQCTFTQQEIGEPHKVTIRRFLCEVRRYADHLLWNSTVKHLRAPIELTIYPTFKCGLDCDFCFLGKARSIHRKEYGYEYWMELVKSVVENGATSVSILGGEPSLYYDLIPLLTELDKLGIRISMTTNGQTWSDDFKGNS